MTRFGTMAAADVRFDETLPTVSKPQRNFQPASQSPAEAKHDRQQRADTYRALRRTFYVILLLIGLIGYTTSLYW